MEFKLSCLMSLGWLHLLPGKAAWPKSGALRDPPPKELWSLSLSFKATAQKWVPSRKAAQILQKS